jgi:integrase
MTKKKHIYNKFYTEEDWAKVNPINKEIMEDYIMELKQSQKKPGTIKNYKSDWKIIFIKILHDFGNKPILEMSKKDFRRLSLYFKEECNHSNARVNRLMSAVRSMLAYCEDDEDWDYDFSAASRLKGLPKEKVKDIVFLTDEQILKLYEELEQTEEYQMATILALAYESAGRKNELFQCTKQSFIEGRYFTNEVIGKRGKKFVLVYNDKTLYFAKKYLEQRGKDNLDEMWTKQVGDKIEPISSGTIYDWFKKMSDILSKIEDVEIDFNVHSLRHTALDNLSTGEHYLCKKVGKEDGFKLEELQKYAHHSSSDTTSSYLQNRDRDVIFGMFDIEE